MSVLKAKRKPSQFEVFHHFYKMRKMKKLAPKLSEKEFTDWYKSWFKNHYRIMSRQQRSNTDTLFNQLKEVTKCSTQSPSPMVAS